MVKAHVKRFDLPGQLCAQNFGVVDLLVDFITLVDEVEVHPFGPTGPRGNLVLRHHALEQLRRSLRALKRNRVIMLAGAHDRGREGVHELLAGFHGFAYGLGAAGIVISGMNAKLVDARRGVQHAEGIEEMNLVSFFCQTNSGGGAVNSSAGDGNFMSMSHDETSFIIRHSCHEGRKSRSLASLVMTMMKLALRLSSR